jgi:hypothetical protein
LVARPRPGPIGAGDPVIRCLHSVVGLVELMQNGLTSQARSERSFWTSLLSLVVWMQRRPVRLHACVQHLKPLFSLGLPPAPHCSSLTSCHRAALRSATTSRAALSPPLSRPLPFLSRPVMVGLKLASCSSLPYPLPVLRRC